MGSRNLGAKSEGQRAKGKGQRAKSLGSMTYVLCSMIIPIMTICLAVHVFADSFPESPQIQQLKSNIDKWQLELEVLMKTYTGRYPEVVQLKQKIAVAQERLRSEITELALERKRDSDTTSDIVKIVIGPAKLKEEINLTGATLKELTGEDPNLSGLKQISLKTYRMPAPPSDAEIEALSDARGTDEDWRVILARSMSTQCSIQAVGEGWQVIRHRIDEGKAVLICGKEKDGVREKLLILLIAPPEFSEMNLVGEIELSALNELRNAILRSMPGFDRLRSLEELFSARSSPSQEVSGEIIRRMKRVIESRGEQTPLEMYYQLGLAYEHMGEYEKARSYYNSIVKGTDIPGWLLIRAYHGLAQCSERLGKPDDAIRYYKLLLEKFGSESDVLPSALDRMRRLERAKAESSYGEMLMESADKLSHKFGRHEEAIGIYQEIVDSMPDSSYAASALLKMGIAYGRLNQQEKQIETFEKAVNEHPSVNNHRYLAMAYQEAGRYEDALEHYKAIINDYSDAGDWSYMKAYKGAGECSESLGMAEEAKGYYKKLTEKFGHISDPVVAMAEKKLVMMERGDSVPFLGVGFRHTGAVKGALIVTVFTNGPCKAAGVQPGDVILAIDSQPTPNPRAVIKIMGGKNIGDEATLLIRRKGEEMEVSVTLTKKPEKLER